MHQSILFMIILAILVMKPVIFRTTVIDMLFFLLTGQQWKWLTWTLLLTSCLPTRRMTEEYVMKHVSPFDSVMNPRALNPLYPSISKHILHTVLYTFPEVLTRRFCLLNKASFVGNHFLHSHDLNMWFRVWYCREKLDASHC